ncbi:hypothetical protein RIF29_15137 [Crotalaria pallida]|uniref:Uncharacterized protein n=1 Tax=Crotalaria pallida TaxID=3830 RepID=A0AAN9FGQ8_CROPI
MVHCPWCMITGAWSGARSVVPGAWCLAPGAWSGARSVVPGSGILVNGALSLCVIPGAWILVHGLVRDPWYLVHGSRCLVPSAWCMVPCPWCMDPGGLAGCLPMHHGGSGWCAMGASPNAFSSHPMDVWSVFPWRGGDSRESSLEPNPGRTWPGACWSLGKIRAPWCDLVWHGGCKADASRERSLVPIGNLGASHDAIISRV